MSRRLPWRFRTLEIMTFHKNKKNNNKYPPPKSIKKQYPHNAMEFEDRPFTTFITAYVSQLKNTTLFFQLGYSFYFDVFRKCFYETFRNLKLASSEKEIIIYLCGVFWAFQQQSTQPDIEAYYVFKIFFRINFHFTPFQIPGWWEILKAKWR